MTREQLLARLAASQMTRRDFLLTPGEVAILFAVGLQTVRRWCARGELDYILTAGGHRRILSRSVLVALTRLGEPLPVLSQTGS